MLLKKKQFLIILLTIQKFLLILTEQILMKEGSSDKENSDKEKSDEENSDEENFDEEN